MANPLLSWFPTLTVEAGFGSSPNTAISSITWTDISSYVRSFSTQRGRSHELQPNAAGTATIRLNNRDRRFEPEYSMSPYYPNVLPLVPIRISATWNGTLYPIGVFFVEEWPVAWKGVYDSEVTVRATDYYEMLNNVDLNTSYSQELSSTRVTNVLNTIGQASADRAIGTGASNVQAVTLADTSALQHLQDVASAEFGFFFVARTGQIKFVGRTEQYLSPYNTSQATYGDQSMELPYTNLVFAYTKNEIRNDIRVTIPGGTTQTANDSTSIGKFAKRTYSITPILTTDTEAGNLATSLLDTYKDPHSRVTQFLVSPKMNPDDLWPEVLTHDIADRITLKRTPPPSGTTRIIHDYAIQGIAHNVQQSAQGSSWEVTFSLGPVAATGAWILGTSALGTDTTLVY